MFIGFIVSGKLGNFSKYTEALFYFMRKTSGRRATSMQEGVNVQRVCFPKRQREDK